MKILVTGSAGFIGFSLTKRLLSRGDQVIGLDNLNDYYDVSLKHARLDLLNGYENFVDVRGDIKDTNLIQELFTTYQPQRVVHLAAQAGVRYSLENPHAYVNSNLVGFVNILEACRHNNIEHLVYASSSSVYGANSNMPYSERCGANHPLSLYAASKRSNELLAHSYSHLFALPTTGLRFFTVYGPWGRPDMAFFLFTRAILRNEAIDVFNHGHHKRDFTYIDDIVEGIVRIIEQVASPDPNWNSDNPDPANSLAPYRLYNIGSNNPVELSRYIETIEECIGKKAKKNYLPMQAGDVASTSADVSSLFETVGYKPTTSIEEGIAKFVKWYRNFYQV